MFINCEFGIREQSYVGSSDVSISNCIVLPTTKLRLLKHNDERRLNLLTYNVLLLIYR